MIVIQGQKWPYSYGMGPKMVIFFNFPGYFAHLLSSYSSRNLKEDYAGCTVTITEEKKGFIVIQGKKISILWLFLGKKCLFLTYHEDFGSLVKQLHCYN